MAGCSSCFPIFREAIAPYIELGFEPKALTDRLVEMQLGAFSFRRTMFSSGPITS
jgi:hypothetical protein